MAHPRLPALLARARRRSLVTVTAGAGWGKTVLAEQWATATGAAWCTLDAGDADPARLATSLLAAGGAPDARPEAAVTGADGLDQLAAAVVAGWRSLGVRGVVLDEVDAVLGTAGHQLLRRLRTAAEPALQLVVVARADVGLVGPRDRAAGDVMELDATHLALDAGRVAQVVADELGPAPVLAGRIADATHGWPAAVRLVVDALQDVPAEQRPCRVAALVGADGPVAAYLEAEQLPTFDPDTERALTRLSLAEGATVDGLAAALDLPSTTAARWLARRSTEGVLRVDADGAGRVAVQPTLREVLAARVAQTGSEVAVTARGVAPPITRVRALGAFVVERGDGPIPATAWGSRKARELLKVLAAAEGRHVSRERLADVLWSGEPYAQVANRLSVALSVVRRVLADGDAARDAARGDARDAARGDARDAARGAALRADATSVALDVDVVELDVRRFRQLADQGAALVRAGDLDAALTRFLAAAELYGGDLLEDDDASWVVDRREGLRSLYVSVLHRAAQLLNDTDPDQALWLLLGILDRDAYDEPAHLGICRALLRGGHHGEARRRHQLYTARMAELGLPAVPLHELVATVATSPAGPLGRVAGVGS